MNLESVLVVYLVCKGNHTSYDDVLQNKTVIVQDVHFDWLRLLYEHTDTERSLRCLIYPLVLDLTSGAPASKFEPWRRPCAGNSPSILVNLPLTTTVTPEEIIQNLIKKSTLFLQKVDNALSYLKKRVLADNDLISILDSHPKVESFPKNHVISQDVDVRKENYLRISKLYILIEHFKKFDIDRAFRRLSNILLVSLNDIMCEFSLLVDISDYQPIRNLDRSMINQRYETFTVSEFYRWDYILLRDAKTFGTSVLNLVKSHQIAG